MTVPAWIPWWTTVGGDPQHPRRRSMHVSVTLHQRLHRKGLSRCPDEAAVAGRSFEVAKLMRRAAFNVEEN
jgi:hypothetical protein